MTPTLHPKTSRTPSKSKKPTAKGKQIRSILIQRSREALTRAKQEILSEKIQSKEAQIALEYYVENWKEAIHPGLMNFVSEAIGGKSENIVDLQVCMLLFAAAVDLHDDIIDNSTEKYGIHTVFGKFGRDVAILLGNGFMIEGFASLQKAMKKFSPEAQEEIFKTVKSAMFEVGDAHALELSLKRRWDANPDEYFEVLEKKGAIIEAEAKLAAIASGGTRRQVAAMARYGRILGLLGTLREDFVDTFEMPEILHRIQNECLPIPVMYALQDAEAKAKIQTTLSKRNMGEKDLWETIDAIFRTEGVRKLKKRMSDAAMEAAGLASLLEEDAKRFLDGLARSMLEDL